MAEIVLLSGGGWGLQLQVRETFWDHVSRTWSVPTGSKQSRVPESHTGGPDVPGTWVAELKGRLSWLY